jgi:putative ABC transport system ATP-binding protein
LGLLQAPTSGSYYWDGIDLLSLDRAQQAEFRRKRLGFVFQACDLLENSNVYENLEFPLIYEGVEKHERPPRIQEALERVNLGHRLYHSANLLSGGERSGWLSPGPW